MLTIGSGIGIISVATLVTDTILQFFMRKRFANVLEKKYQNVMDGAPLFSLKTGTINDPLLKM